MNKTLLAAAVALPALLCATGALALEVKTTGTVRSYDETMKTFVLEDGQTYYLTQPLPYTAQDALIHLAPGKQVMVTTSKTAGMNVVTDMETPKVAIAQTAPAVGPTVASKLEGRIVALNHEARTLTLDNGHEYKIAQGIELGGLTVGRTVALGITEGGGAPLVAAVTTTN